MSSGRVRTCVKLCSGRYDIIRELNRGGTATVYEAHDLRKETRVAVKVINQGTPESDVDMLLARESNAQSLQHPGIVRLLHVFREGPQQRLCIVSELVNGQDLLDTINAHGGHLQEETAKDYFCQLLEVIQYLHSRNICHRDIKPENVMVDKEGNVRVIDFGMSKHITSAKTLMVGTADYLAPELLGPSFETHSGTYDGRETDLWALGVTLYLMVVGKYPFEDPEKPHNISATLKNVSKGTYRPMPEHLSSPELRDLVRALLVKDPKKRATMADVMASPWITSYLKNSSDSGESMDVDDSSSEHSKDTTKKPRRKWWRIGSKRH